MKNENPNNNAFYSLDIVRGVLVIYSTNKKEGKSVTNDMERILKEVKQVLQEKMPEKIICEDSEGIFDQVILKDNSFEFGHLGQTTVAYALNKLLGEEVKNAT